MIIPVIWRYGFPTATVCWIRDLLFYFHFLNNHSIPSPLNETDLSLSCQTPTRKFQVQESDSDSHWRGLPATKVHFLRISGWSRGDAAGCIWEQFASWDGHELIMGKGMEISETFRTFILQGSLIHTLGFLWKEIFWM